jgi:hypothetical protein
MVKRMTTDCCVGVTLTAARGTRALPRMRWITVGTVQPNYYLVILNHGIPGGLLMRWRGRLTFGQPWGFVTWNDLIGTVKTRLQFARLEAHSFASAIERDNYGTEIVLMALVGRKVSSFRFQVAGL